MKLWSFSACGAIVSLFCLYAPEARAQNFWYGVNPTQPTWDQGANWSQGFPPFPTNDAVFQAPIPPIVGPTITLSPGETANSLDFAANYTLTGGTIQLNAGSNPYSGIVAVAKGSVVTINSALVGPNPLIVGTMPNVGGGGTLILNAINTYTGNTYVTMGSLYVNGSLASANVSVSNGAVLGGTGTLYGNVVNAGTLVSGGSSGTLRIGGGYTQTTGGVLSIAVGGPNQTSLLQIGGQANLSGTLQLVRLNNFNFQRGNEITLLTAGGGISGQFSTIADPFASGTIIGTTVIYTGSSVILEAVQGSFRQFAQSESLTPNETAVARALDRVVNDRRANSLINFLDAEPLSKLPRDFDRLAPEDLTSIFTISTALAEVQSLNVQRRADDLRSGASGFSAANLAINGDGPSYSGGFSITTGVGGPSGDDGKEVKETKEMKTIAPEENRWGAFLSGTGQWVSVGDTSNARGYDLESGGFTLGVDYKVTPNFAVGVAAGYTGTTADLVDHGRVWVNGGKLGLYSTVFTGGWYADAAAFGGYNSYDTRRAGLEGDARGSADGGEFNGLVGTGYDFKSGGLTVGPTATFNYTYVGLDGFTESGSLAPLDVHGGNVDSIRSALGFKLNYDWKVAGITVKPELRAAWQHEYGDTSYALSSTLDNDSAGAFTVHGPRLGRDSALLSAGFAVQCSDRCSTYIYYDGELGRTNYHAASVTGGLRVSF